MSPNAMNTEEITSTLSKPTEKNEVVDQDSLRGRFGWCEIGGKPIPFIFRGNNKEQYVSLRMFHEKHINQFLSVLPNEISFYMIQSYYITQAESRLLNEININHSGSFFGKSMFHFLETIVKLEDAIEFHHFVSLCYNTIVKKERNDSKRCGFIRIGGESVIPFTVNQSQKCVPLFYLEDVSENLTLQSIVINGWDLAYLKFCCKLQGIKPFLYQTEECQVAPLDQIKDYFPPETVFEDYWPNQVGLQINNKQIISQASWISKPLGQPHSFGGVPNKQAIIDAKTVSNIALPSNGPGKLTTPNQASVQRQNIPLQNKRLPYTVTAQGSESLPERVQRNAKRLKNVANDYRYVNEAIPRYLPTASVK